MPPSRVLLALGLAAPLLGFALLRIAWAGEQITQQMSVSSDGTRGNEPSLSAAVSGDGMFIAFASDASNLVPGDTNGTRDIFVRDALRGATELVSVASDGAQANRFALSPAISGDGRYVVFHSDADTLVADDTNDASDVFLHDRLTGTTERLSVSSDGTQGNSDSVTASISGDGRYVTFTSLANNLVADDANEDRDVFVHDRLTGTTTLVSVASDGTHGDFNSGGLGAGPASISPDGRFVVFGSFARNLVPDDTNGHDDIFVHDRDTGVTERVSVATNGTEGNSHSVYGSISDNGRYVVFASLSDNLMEDDTNEANDIFLRDRQTGTTIRLSETPGGAGGNGASRFPVISGDGQVVAFQSDASNLVPDDTNDVSDIFRYFIETGELERVSAALDGSESDGPSSFASISGDGSLIAFESLATNLAPSDTNDVSDVFARVQSSAPLPGAIGDVNCDGTTNSIDATLILQRDASLIDTLACQGAADVNEDGVSNAIDALLLLQFGAGLLPSLPP